MDLKNWCAVPRGRQLRRKHFFRLKKSDTLKRGEKWFIYAAKPYTSNKKSKKKIN